MLKQELTTNRLLFSIAIALVCFPTTIAAQNVTTITQSTDSQTNKQLSVTQTEITQNVTSTSQFRDVNPTDWAFPALQSLVERYGCIAGYPDGTFRGNQAMTRYEFVAGMSNCLDKLNEKFSEQLDRKASKEELQRLQTELSKQSQELAALADSVKHYYVIVPSTSESLLEKAREIVPTAKISSSRLGKYIEIQGFNKRSSAEALNTTVRSRGFDSRVIYEN
ncbi:iron uptake porin [Tumidithrix elongata RA019]|uniref:Iron uptake porin n=1 Tax=Tumidithrix elongata BACA0141 TaxID=2716417 RepID=A0AAW9Q7K0_9CYAN|nr:iron uptake porin [Tumidithrix elongata RA019]